MQMKTQERVRPSAEQKLGTIGKSIDEWLEQSKMAETAVTVRDEILKELKRIDKQLAAARAQIDQDLATTRKDFAEAVRAELEVWKKRVQELDVQAALGRMELRDRVRPVIDRIEVHLARIRRDIEKLEADAPDEETTTASIQTSMKDLRKEIKAVDEIC
jgi:chromosome segregation ATPase